MIYRNHTPRCPHGFAKGIVRCQVCEPSISLVPEEFRQKPTFWKFRIGGVYGGVTLTERLTKERVNVRCGCGNAFEISRSAVQRHHRAGTTCMCPKCTEDKNPRLRGVMYRGAHSG